MESIHAAEPFYTTMIRIISICLCLCWMNVIHAQLVSFSKVFSNFPLNPENGILIKETNDGYLLLSFSACLDNGNAECCALAKLDNYGNVAWFKQYPFHQGSNTLVVHNDLIYVAGHTNEPNSQYTLYCIDSLGVVVWNKAYGDPSKNSESPRLALWGNTFVLCGLQDRNINNRPAPLLYFVVTDLVGNQVNEFYYGDENETTLARKIFIDTDGNCLTSFVYCPASCFLDLKAGVVAFTMAGNFIWELDLPFSYSTAGCYHAQTDSNTIAVKWYVDNTTMPNYDLTPPAIYFSDLFGNVSDTLIFQNQTLKDIFDIEPVWKQGIIGCGGEYPDYLNQPSQPLFGWLFRMNETREVLWERSYIDSSYQGRTLGLRHIIPTNDGGYMATGTITNFMNGVWESHNWLLKLDSLGCLEPGCGNINYITDTEEVVFLKGIGLKIFPNPASDYVQVGFPNEFSINDVTMHLISNEGKTIRQSNVYSSQQLFSLSGIVSGTYYILIIRRNEIIGSKRIVIINKQ